MLGYLWLFKAISFKKSESIGFPMDLQENAEWVEWHTDVLLKRNAGENVYQWACGYAFLCLFLFQDHKFHYHHKTFVTFHNFL